MSNKGLKLEKENYTIEIKYSDEAVEKKLLKFTVTNGNEIVLSADEIISMLVGQVNSEVLAAAFVETNKVNVVEVGRQLQCKLDKDFKKGDVININYTHPYPVEFAIIEEAFKIAQISPGSKVTELTVEFLEDVKKRITPKMIDFTQKFYQSFKSVDIKDKKMSEEIQINEEVNVVLGKYRVLGEINFTNEVGEPQGVLEIGSIQEVPAVVGEQWVVDGTAERVEDEVDSEATIESETDPDPVAPVDGAVETEAI